VTEAARLGAIALEVARAAGALALGGFRRRMDVAEKGAHDLVTEFDLASERLIRERLTQLTPEIPVVGEEEGGTPSATRVWYCDPIDGTTNYAHGHPVWCVSVGVLEGDTPVAGAVVAPALGVEWCAHAGGPALRNGEPCRVSETAALEQALLATGFPRDREQEPHNNFETFVRVKKRCRGVRRCGAAAVDLCWVADGTYDGYWERRLNPWDLAAGAAIVLAAGGRAGAPPRRRHRRDQRPCPRLTGCADAGLGAAALPASGPRRQPLRLCRFTDGRRQLAGWVRGRPHGVVQADSRPAAALGPLPADGARPEDPVAGRGPPAAPGSTPGACVGVRRSDERLPARAATALRRAGGRAARAPGP
jgi:myo-inositol-1(or 4)-monophosphatase